MTKQNFNIIVIYKNIFIFEIINIFLNGTRGKRQHRDIDISVIRN